MKTHPTLSRRAAALRRNGFVSLSSCLATTPCKAFFFGILLFGSSILFAQASDPIGIYALVHKVVFEPNTNAPDRVQIWGIFSLAEGRGENYRPAQRGYLYFKLKEDKATLCRNEWNDLKSVVGSDQIVSFGTRYENKATVRKPDAKPENPETYPLGWGMQKVSMKDYKPLNDLRALSTEKSAAAKPKQVAPTASPRP